MDSPTSILLFILELTDPAHPRRRLRTAANSRIEYACGDNNANNPDPEADYETKHDVHNFPNDPKFSHGHRRPALKC
jgi:hypothetical protein